MSPSLLLCATTTILLCVLVLGTTTPPPLVPALYVFGDSTVDGGNRLVNYGPYGMDLNSTDIPVRFTNGLTIADEIASCMSLPIVPPYNNTAAAARSLTGVNFALGGCGLLLQTGPEGWTLREQILKFSSLKYGNLTKSFPNAEDLEEHLAKSIFLVSIGINDFAQNYLEISVPRPLRHLSPKAFSVVMLTQMASDLTSLYGLGARRFLVNNIWPLGCTPKYENESSPLAVCCNQTVNSMVLPYSNDLSAMLEGLHSNLSGAVFSHSNNFQFVKELKEHVGKYGISNTTARCYNAPSSSACADRDSYLYFDDLHTSQAANVAFSTECYNGGLCIPNIIQLAGRRIN